MTEDLSDPVAEALNTLSFYPDRDQAVKALLSAFTRAFEMDHYGTASIEDVLLIAVRNLPGGATGEHKLSEAVKEGLDTPDEEIGA